jgi:hypothetical protein
VRQLNGVSAQDLRASRDAKLGHLTSTSMPIMTTAHQDDKDSGTCGGVEEM